MNNNPPCDHGWKPPQSPKMANSFNNSFNNHCEDIRTICFIKYKLFRMRQNKF